MKQTKTLNVFLYDKKIGVLKNNAGRLSFEYVDNPEYQLSLSMPLENKAYGNNTSQKFFSNLLPEGYLREVIARQYGIKENVVFPFLEKIGGECAGAISIYTDDFVRKETDKVIFEKQDFEKSMRELNSYPLMVRENIRLSLAGVQEKKAIRIEENIDSMVINKNIEFFKPDVNFASTHIVKAKIDGVEDSIYNELFCMLLAKRILKTVPDVSLYKNNNLKCLFIKRYDRVKNTNYEKLHQEDFCQILLVFPEEKYEENNKGISVRSIYKIINQYCNDDDSKIRFLKYIIFNFLIGNNDAHGKNFSILYNKKNNRPQLAPAYDLLSTSIYDNLDKKMAMKIGGEYDCRKITGQHFIRMATEIGIKERLMGLLIDEICDSILVEANELKKELNYFNVKSLIFEKIMDEIRGNVDRMER